MFRASIENIFRSRVATCSPIDVVSQTVDGNATTCSFNINNNMNIINMHINTKIVKNININIDLILI